ncbi:uncharacterized protein KY384_002642 [Bacidia gigantensis]|uniref:uncharacterized protein n=1 Tax=Bacidia gigantensis TaxID=2732470 RepID=UPI001D040387|nr:uncharacterized protein KY384_002642 [Bacidia gigantensis]KAG8532764.1 hypothetical protein KY384_002642 [Bacidia gigantensis]
MPLRVLFESPSADDDLHKAVDVVAVHGLHEVSEACWEVEPSRKSWLKDILPDGVPVRRVLNYSYVANLSTLLGDDPANNILQTSHSLVADLEGFRSLDNTAERPLIFVCHDLGGIIVKKALAYSATRVSQKVEHLYSIYLSTYAILFFGTPHYGYNTQAWQWMAGRLPASSTRQSHLSASIARFDEILQNTTDEFAPIVKQYHIYFFWESQPSLLDQIKAYVVSQESAAPVWDRTERCGIEASHFTMCKFSSDTSPGFTTVMAALKRYGLECHVIVKRRWQVARKFLETQRSIEATELVGFDVHEANKPYTYINSPKHQRHSKMENKYYYVPHNVSVFYTGWESVTRELQQSFLSPPSPLSGRKRRIFVLYGLGGSGKTQFCLKFVHDHRQRFWAIFWLDASRIENAERDLSQIGKLGGLGDTHQAGLYWLTGLSLPWLLVLDNADDPDTDYAKYFPDGPTGHILVTSRLKACKTHATVGSHEFRQMGAEDSAKLLLRAAGLNSAVSVNQCGIARNIARKLGYLPLALTQAGASIRQNICTLEEYLELYDMHKAEMLKDHLVQGTDQYKHTIYTTWEVSVQRIQKTGTKVATDALEILYTMAFLHFERIPRDLFFNAWVNMKRSTSFLPRATNGEELRFRRALSLLESHSLVYLDAGGKSYTMHPMVHLWSRERFDSEEQQLWSDIAVNVLSESLAIVANKSSREYRRGLIPHIDACLSQQHRAATFVKYQDTQTLAKAMKFSDVYAENGEWHKAEGLQRRVVKAREEQLGLAHADTLDVMAQLADGCWNLFNIPEAILLYGKIAENGAQAYGTQDPRALKVIDNMAKTLWLAGKTSEALRWSERATIAMTTELGEGHPDTLTAVFNLARNHIHQGSPEEAAKKLEFVLAQRRRMLGESHPDTLSAFAELGVACYHLRQLDKAEDLLNRVLHERSRILGSHHAYTLWAVNDLAKIYTEQGRSKEAEHLLTDILDIVTLTLGAEHIGMLMTKYNLVRAYNGQGKWAQGRTTLLELMAIQGRKLPAMHPDCLSSRLELARTKRHLGELEPAERELRGLIEEMKKVLGQHHPQTKRAMGQLSAIYINMGRLEEAEELDQGLRRIGSSIYGEEEMAKPVEQNASVLMMGRRKVRNKPINTW